MKRVILESPFSPSNGFTTEQNIAYAKLCFLDCLKRNEAPIASHLLIAANNILDDTNPKERELGMSAGFAWVKQGVAEYSVFYENLGVSSGMRAGLQRAVAAGIPCVHRKLENYTPPKPVIVAAPNSNSKSPINIGELWKTRNGSTVKIISTHDACKDYIFYVIEFQNDPSGAPRDFTSTVGPNGLYFPPLHGIIREHEHDLISRINK